MAFFYSSLSASFFVSAHLLPHLPSLSQVQPGVGDKAALSDMRSLSGGERSFSTVCFVLSLWAIAEAPFRALDEFDVYMVMSPHQMDGWMNDLTILKCILKGYFEM